MKLLPKLEGVVWWYLPEPTSGYNGFDEYKLWLETLKVKLIKLKSLIDTVRAYGKGDQNAKVYLQVALSEKHKIKCMNRKGTVPTFFNS